ncbi:MAG: transcriptional regulator GcvA [Hyphomicrobiaceae bacterium]|nr:transcriptional regulator GcvA [Hyphomicrobiaceae bacterium]
MSNKRYDLPPLDLMQSFEAAARHLSFTKAADELALTQSAISRQIKALEESLGVALFERQHRALVLTEEGVALQRIATETLERLQVAFDGLRPLKQGRQIAITTTTGFAALWLIPRLQRFTSRSGDIDVRLSATDTALNLDRTLVDVAIRYSSRDTAPQGAVPLFGEEIVPVCSPSLVASNVAPLKAPRDLQHHALLHFDYPGMQKTWFDWGTWLTAFGVADLKPASALHFSQYDQLIQAAVSGQGVALGRLPLLADMMRSGALIAPFEKAVCSSRGYYVIRSAAAQKKPYVDEFCAWLFAEAKSG